MRGDCAGTDEMMMMNDEKGRMCRKGRGRDAMDRRRMGRKMSTRQRKPLDVGCSSPTERVLMAGGRRGGEDVVPARRP